MEKYICPIGLYFLFKSYGFPDNLKMDIKSIFSDFCIQQQTIAWKENTAMKIEIRKFFCLL
jgi:hypothetical protein